VKLTGKWQWSQAALRGIGHAIAVAMARGGADLLIAGPVHGERCTKPSRRIGALGRRCVVVQADVADEAAVKGVIAHTVQHFGGLDNPGQPMPHCSFKRSTSSAPRSLHVSLDVNLKGPWLCASMPCPS